MQTRKPSLRSTFPLLEHCGGHMNYYENNATAFVESTRLVDMQPCYQRFLPLLPKQAHILDAGCGSGRDAKQLIEQGYKVTAFDSSAKIAALAEKKADQAISVQHLQDIQYQNQFDAICVCITIACSKQRISRCFSASNTRTKTPRRDLLLIQIWTE